MSLSATTMMGLVYQKEFEYGPYMRGHVLCNFIFMEVPHLALKHFFGQCMYVCMYNLLPKIQKISGKKKQGDFFLNKIIIN